MVHYYLRCGALMPFCGRFWCGFCGVRMVSEVSVDNLSGESSRAL